MKKYYVLLMGLLIIISLNSCLEDDPVSPSKTSFWKLTGKEINWMHKTQGDQYSEWETISAVPYGTKYTVIMTTDTYDYTLLGEDYDFTCIDSSYALAHKWTTNFAWDPLPITMLADTLYQIAAETKGDGGNMTHISNSYNYPGTSNDWIVAAARNAGKTFAKVKISKPIDVENPGKRAIRVSISCAYGQIEHTYIYEWVTE